MIIGFIYFIYYLWFEMLKRISYTKFVMLFMFKAVELIKCNYLNSRGFQCLTELEVHKLCS